MADPLKISGNCKRTPAIPAGPTSDESQRDYGVPDMVTKVLG